MNRAPRAKKPYDSGSPTGRINATASGGRGGSLAATARAGLRRLLSESGGSAGPRLTELACDWLSAANLSIQ